MAKYIRDIEWLLDAPIVNLTESAVEKSIKTNADFQYDAGLKPRVIRRSSGYCCEWCASLEGEYEYPDVPDEVWMRHRNCTCIVEYYPGDGRKQNVHTKQWVNTGRDERIRFAQTERAFAKASYSFNTEADPMAEVFGPGVLSHPEEIKTFREELKNMGVELIEADYEVFSYQPAPVPGKPGRMLIWKRGSYSAWCHEMKHVRDDYDAGWSGGRIWADLDECFRREKRAYEIEIQMARDSKRPDIVERLQKNLELERKRIYGE